MSRTTLSGALTEIHTLLADDPTQDVATPVASLVTAGVSKVLNHEPGATGVPAPCAVTVEPVGIDPEFWPVRVRVYVSDGPGKLPQSRMVAAMVAIDDAFKAADAFGPSRWQSGWNEEIGCHVAFCDLMVGREDGF